MKKIILSVLLPLTLLSFTGCSKDNDDLMRNNTPPLGAHTVRMQGSAYSIDSLTVISGSTVTWINDDNMIHTVTADNGSFDSGDIPPGGTYVLTLTTIGTYPYHCKYHSSMKATVNVIIGR